jgi:hypothetical protein
VKLLIIIPLLYFLPVTGIGQVQPKAIDTLREYRLWMRGPASEAFPNLTLKSRLKVLQFIDTIDCLNIGEMEFCPHRNLICWDSIINTTGEKVKKEYPYDLRKACKGWTTKTPGM